MLKKMQKNQVIVLFFVLFFMFLGFFMGQYLNRYIKRDDISVIYNNDVYTFRDENGSIIYPIEKDGIVYLPLNELGTYLDYMTVSNEKGVYLYKKEDTNQKSLQDLDTETFDGKKINSSVFNEADYTILLMWSTVCPNCEKVLDDLKSLNEYFDESNIQILSVLTNLDTIQNKDKISIEDYGLIEQKSEGLNIKYTIYRDNAITFNLIGKTVRIPKIVIFDNKGNVIKIIDKDITSEGLKGILDVIKIEG